MLTLIGTLGGVFITALFGFLTTWVTQRGQFRRAEHEHRLQLDRETHAARRQSYAGYIAAAQAVYDTAIAHYRRNRANPIDTDQFSQQVPSEIAEAVAHLEICRAEAHLLAGTAVRTALLEYRLWLGAFWLQAARGAEILRPDGPSEDSLYHRLIQAMHTELVGPAFDTHRTTERRSGPPSS